MRVLIACEFSGRVRNEFRNLGHDAYSCDLLAAEDNSQYHIRGDVINILNNGWDLMIAHPPCTHLASSGARHFKNKKMQQELALEFIRLLLDAPINKIALENPVGIISSRIKKPDQIIQPWEYGHRESKSTCLWLKNLPLLKPTNIVRSFVLDSKTPNVFVGNSIHCEPPSKDRWKNRSRTFIGIAKALAEQYG